MVSLDVVRIDLASLVQRHPLVAVFFGGTSGIGHYTLRALATAEAQNEGKGFRAYVVGRKPSKGEEIIAECRQIYPEARISFVQVDNLSLIRDVDRACAEIIQLEEKETDNSPRIDFLMLSQGGLIFQPRQDTTEGLDKTMSLMYYSRMRAIVQLHPLLVHSCKPATVLSVYAGGFEQKLFADDLSLRKPANYNYSQARSHIAYMHTLFFETLAAQNAGTIALTHVFPGLVNGPAFSDPGYPAWFRGLWKWFFIPVFGRFIMIDPVDCGERMLSLASSRYPALPTDKLTSTVGDVVTATNGKAGGGCYAVTWNGENNFKANVYAKLDKEALRQQVVAHTLKAFEVISNGGVFQE